MEKKQQVFTINIRKRCWECHKVVIREHLATASSISMVETLSSNKPFLSVLLYSPGDLRAFLGQMKLSVDPFAGISAAQLWVSSLFQANALFPSGAFHCSFLFLALYLVVFSFPSCPRMSLHIFFPRWPCSAVFATGTIFPPPEGPSRLQQVGRGRQAFPVLLCCLVTVLCKKTCSEQIKSLHNTLKIW